MNGPQRHRDTEDKKLGVTPPKDLPEEQMNELTSRIIGAAIEVHRTLGPGLLEPMYEAALSIELDDLGISHCRQVRIPAFYKGRALGQYRVDLIVEDAVLVEVKCVERMHPLFEAQVLTYLRVTGKHVGLLINFNSRLLREGVKRLIST